MKRGWILFLFWLVAMSFLVAKASDTPFEVSDNQTNLTELTFRLPTCDVSNVTKGNVNYAQFDNPMGGFTTQEGLPEVPTFSTFVALPAHGTVSLEVVGSDESTTNMCPIPAQGIYLDGTPRDFTRNDSYYNNGGQYPEQVATISSPMIMRDLRVVHLTIYPYSYNAHAKQTTVYNRVTVRIHVNAAQPGVNELTTTRKLSRSFEPLYRMLVANYDQTRDENPDYQARSILVIYPTNTNLATYINQFAEWKRTKGFTVTVASTDQTGTSNTAIKNYILNTYNSANAPEYVVLVGDADNGASLYIPCWYETMSSYQGATDHTYACLAGDDILPEVFIGRMSIGTVQDFQTMLAKMNIYERQVATDDFSMYHHSLLVGDTSPSGNSCIQTNKYAKERILSYDPTHTFTELYNADPSPSQMDTALDAGSLFFSYRGWIGMSGWTGSNISGLTNINKLFNAVIITCGTGPYASGDANTELVIRAGTPSAPKGGIEAIGMSTSGTHTRFNNILHAGVFYGLYSEHMTDMGQALMAGKLALYNAYETVDPTDVAIFSDWCNLMGDPTIDIWHGEPIPMTVTHEATLPLGQNWIDVDVTNSVGNGIEDAWVTARRSGSSILSSGYTDANGHITLHFTSSSGDVNLTVTKPDRIPYLGTFNVGVTGGMAYQSTTLVDDNTGDSEGNGNGIANPGEHIELPVVLHNYSGATCSGITCTLSSTDDYVTIDNATETYPDAAAAADVTCNNNFLVTIASDAPDRHKIQMDLTITLQDGTIYHDRFWIQVAGVDLDVTSTSFSDGDNNILDPSETAQLNVRVDNHGQAPLTAVWGELRSRNDLISVDDSLAYFGDVTVGGHATCTSDNFTVTALAQVLPGMQIPMRLTLYNTDGYREVEDFTIPIGTVTIHDPLGPDSHGYVCYDNEDTGYIDCPDYDWIEVDPTYGGSGTSLNMTDNVDQGDCISEVTLPFTFKFYSIDYNLISVCSNGFISFGPTEQCTFHNWPIPGPKGPNSMIAAMWDDLRTSPGNVFTYYDEGLHYFVIEWSHCSNAANTGAEETFEIILYDPIYYVTSTLDGPIKVQYKVFNDVDTSGGGTFQGNHSTIGLEDPTELIGLQYAYDDNYPTACKHVANNTALYYTGMPIIWADSYLAMGTIFLHDTNSQLDAGETANIGIKLNNIGMSNAYQTFAILTTTDPYVTTIADTSSYPTITSGYGETNCSYFKMAIASNCPDQHVVNFILNITNPDGDWSYPFTMIVHRSQLSFVTAMISDETGNNDGIMDPGETLKLIVNLTNQSTSPADSITAVLTSGSASAQILTENASYGTIQPGKNMQRSFQVSIASDAQVQEAIWFNLTVTGPHQAQQTFSFPVAVGYWGFSHDLEADNGDISAISGWQWGVPSIGAHSGTHCWATQLTSNYGTHVNWVMTSDPFFVGEGSILSFWHYFQTQEGVDGGNVKISLNGADWTLLTPAEGYNTATMNSGNGAIPGQPGFSGDSNGWQLVSFDLSEYSGQNVLISWVFGSDSSNNAYYGWAIDDISVTGGAERTAHIQGTVSMNGPTTNLTNTSVSTGDYTTHPDTDGNYDLYTSIGTFDLLAELAGYAPYQVYNVNCTAGATVPLNIELEYLPPVTHFADTYNNGQLTLTWDYTAPATQVATREKSRESSSRQIFSHFNVWRQLDSGKWTKVDSLLTTNSYTETIVDTYHYRYYVTVTYNLGTSDPTGIIEYPGALVSNNDQTQTPITALEGNYPNPFNPTTTIAYSVAKPGKVSLRVYNIRGELVKTLVNEAQDSGRHTVLWNGHNNNGHSVASGVYFYRLTAGNVTQTKKALLLK